MATASYFIELVDNIWVVVERSTDMAIDGSYDKNKAKERCQFFNSGGGFDGWTPSFLFDLDSSNIAKYNN